MTEVSEFQNEMHGFITEKDRSTNDENKDSMCTRFIRKKFRCFIILFLAIISISELLTTIFSKIDSEILTTLYSKMDTYVKNYKKYNATSHT